MYAYIIYSFLHYLLLERHMLLYVRMTMRYKARQLRAILFLAGTRCICDATDAISVDL